MTKKPMNVKLFSAQSMNFISADCKTSSQELNTAMADIKRKMNALLMSEMEKIGFQHVKDEILPSDNNLGGFGQRVRAMGNTKAKMDQAWTMLSLCIQEITGMPPFKIRGLLDSGWGHKIGSDYVELLLPGKSLDAFIERFQADHSAESIVRAFDSEYPC